MSREKTKGLFFGRWPREDCGNSTISIGRRTGGGGVVGFGGGGKRAGAREKKVINPADFSPAEINSRWVALLKDLEKVETRGVM